MTNNIKIFEKEEFGEVRTLLIDGEPWFIGKDVAKILGYERPTKAVNDHVDFEDKDEVPIQDSIGRMQNTPIINESGLYSLILSSKLPAAKEFKHWVTKEVLPSIRKTGQYSMTDSYLIEDPIARAERWIEEYKEKQALLEQTKEMKPKADYFDKIVDRKLNLNFRDTAKELNIKQNVFIGILQDMGYIYRDSKNKIKPYAKYVNDGIFVLKEYATNTHVGNQTLITPKGREVFRLLVEAM